MKDIASHILDIAQNSTRAKATSVEINIYMNESENIYSFSIKDNGCGMSPELLNKVVEPFTTTRTTRKVGLGIPFLKQNTEQAGGGIKIESTLNVGTTTEAKFQFNHIDRPTMGDLAGSLTLLISSEPDINMIIKVQTETAEFNISTQEIKDAIQGEAINTPQMYILIKELIANNLEEINIKQ